MASASRHGRARHGVEGTWYAHASVGCLHVRPVLNMKDGGDVRKMRAIAEETFAMVREYKGSHSGEHGDGIVRSEFHTPMFGERIVAAFEDVKQSFDPTGLFNPGKIVDPPRMDDRDLFRYRPGYAAAPMETALDWSEWGGLIGAVEMCNNNGECRKAGNGVMCPSYRVTGDEQHVTRGRANTLRLALTGQLGADALAHTVVDDQGTGPAKGLPPVGIGIKRVLVVSGGEARRRNSGLGTKVELDEVEQQIQRCLVLPVATGHADGQNWFATFQHQRRRQRDAGALSGFDAVGMTRRRVEAAQAVAIADACRAAGGLVAADVRARRGADHIAPAVGNHTRRRATDIRSVDTGLLQGLHLDRIAWPSL